MQTQRTVFISYRRTNMYMARAVYQDLRAHGYDAFLDLERLDSGDFSQGLRGQIAARAHFVLILTPSALERCTSAEDWVRKEIEYAIETKRNIVPLMFEGVKFEQVGHFLVSEAMKLLPNYNAVTVPDDYFDEAMERLRGNRFLDRPLETVLHPVAPVAAAAAAAVQQEADAAPAPTVEQLEAEQLFERGFRKARLMSDYEGAIEDFTRAIELKPDYVDAYYHRGNACWNRDHKSEALKNWKLAVQFGPDDPRVNIIRSWIATGEGDTDLALAEAEAGVRHNPDYDEAYFRRAWANHDKGDDGKAINDYSEAIRLNPGFANAYNNRGLSRAAKEDYGAAIADYNEAIRLNPHFALTYYNRGTAFLAMNNHAGALANFDEAIRLNPLLATAYHNRGLVRNLNGDSRGALEDYGEAIRLNPQFALAYLNRGVIYYQEHNYEQSIADFEAVLTINPTDELAKKNLELAQQQKKKAEDKQK